ncbi:Potassium voltage-gated channel subfamily H member 7 [Chlorella sorokiniana]|uniref:Potassium voltage-gated channel subfamily H member 7 n=1 Tax=Chlorella sorokiniana TaxID=3076 RepID=A0A2P6TDY1_CHLSO|nr:Potassium voltage-gated channel subfamily H member 7 [Chlorella sorokiniana]|eukprot:PRW20847.1 Potassium voltage-gated channel subfamily H member 7 [Chlorella sorokiniana]
MAEVALPAVPAQTAGAAAEQPAAQPPVQRMLSSQRPPPSPFEDVPAADAAARPPLHPGTVAVPSGAVDAAADAGGDRRSPRSIKPSKSALKISSDGGAPAAPQQPAANRALSWADTHGKEIHHVQEYQPSDHGSESFMHRTFGCNCCIQ